MLLGVGADWQDVLIALLTFAGVIFNGFVVIYVATHVRTPSRRSLGELVEETHSITAGRVVEQLKRIEANGPGKDDTGQVAE